MLILRRVLGVLSIGLSLFSIICIFAAFGSHDHSASTNIAVSIFFLGTTVGFGFLARWGLGPIGPAGDPKAVRSAQIRQILKVAQASGGELSLMEVAAETTLSIEESRTFLEDLVAEGIAQMRVDEDGVILYEFPDFHPQIYRELKG